MFVLVNFSLATFMDPGVIPRGKINIMLFGRMHQSLSKASINYFYNLQQNQMRTERMIFELLCTEVWILMESL